MGIPIGAVLQSADSNAVVTVVSGTKVIFEGEEISLTRATKRVYEIPLETQIRPTRYWTYFGSIVTGHLQRNLSRRRVMILAIVTLFDCQQFVCTPLIWPRQIVCWPAASAC